MTLLVVMALIGALAPSALPKKCGGEDFEVVPPSTDHLCAEWAANREDLEDPINIHCNIEKGTFAEPNATAGDQIKVVTWNIERGHYVDDLIDLFVNDQRINDTDIYLLSEVDRYCDRTGDRNIAFEIADALGYDYAYGVEFVEINSGRGEHGQAIISRFPITQVDQQRLTDFEDWQGRLGGRMALYGTVKIGDTDLNLLSIHTMSEPFPYIEGRKTQFQEILDFADERPGPTLIGGDFNVVLEYLIGSDPTVNLIRDNGYDDNLRDESHDLTWTAMTEFGDEGEIRTRLDYIFFRDIPLIDGAVYYDDEFVGLSDHWGQYGRFDVSGF
ncbi:endonuclease/exonuclease/phosphatase family protein [bacterium]|nr:endonuclease/exonuclease/phosphatase family protein [bacterium]